MRAESITAARFGVSGIGVTEVAGEFKWGHEDMAAEFAVEAGWEGGIPFIHEVEVQYDLSRNFFRAFTPWAEIGHGWLVAELG